MANLISIFDYPRDLYTHYWEIQIFPDTARMDWKITFYPYREGTVQEFTGSTNLPRNGTYEQRMLKARELSQKFVLDLMPTYRRTLEDLEKARLDREAVLAEKNAAARLIESLPVRDGAGNEVALDDQGNPIYPTIQ